MRLPIPIRYASRLLLYILVAFWTLTLCSQCAHAQGLPPDMILAYTECYKGKGYTFINAEAMVADSLPWLLRHEQVHRDQITRAGGCIDWTDTMTQLRDEVEAYCDGQPLRMAFKHISYAAALDDSFIRLSNQFGSRLPPEAIYNALLDKCGSPPWSLINSWRKP